jgi:predicted dehydrogenase
MGVIGVGYLGQHHARIYSEIKDADLAAVADTDSTRAADIAGKFGCRHSASYSDIFEFCDAISIATPTTTHYRVAMDCLEAGKDILIEKPITEDIGEAEAIIAEAEKRDRIIQVGHLERYNQGIITASRFIGEPRFIESERISPFLGRGTDVDVTLDLMIHDIDLIISIVHSKLRDIRAIGESIITEKIDVAKAWLEFENGCTALITANRLSAEKKRRLKIHQRDSFILVDYQSQEVRRYYKDAERRMAVDTIQPEHKEPLREELLDFIQCIHNRTAPQVSGRDALYALEVVVKITELLKQKNRRDNERALRG